MIQILESPSASERLQVAGTFLGAAPPGTEVLLVGASRDAVDDLVRQLSQQGGATFGLHRFTLTQLAARLAAPALSASGLATFTRLASEAVAARAAFEAHAADRIPYFAPVARCPGFGRTLAASITELRAAGVDPDTLAAAGAPAAQLAWLLGAYAEQLERARLADRAILLQAAAGAIAAADRDPIVNCPTLLLDVAIETRGERDLVAALCAAAPRVLATVPSGDQRTLDALHSIAGDKPTPLWKRGVRGDFGPGAGEKIPPDFPFSKGGGSLARLQTYLFSAADPPAAPMDDTVHFFSAPGEGRETVEIARAVLAEARAGVPFDRMVVFLRTPESYTALLETAFRRAAIPAYFARGTRRPNPAGRAFLALLACAADDLSAARFAEYLSFGEVPALDADGTAPERAGMWAGPRDEALGAAGAGDANDGKDDNDSNDGGDRDSFSAPWKWEELLVDAAVIGGAERWARRLQGLAHELDTRHAELASDEPDSPRLAGIARARANLDRLRRFALPVVEQLGALPGRATWGEWLERLALLAPQVLRRPEGVLQVLAELAPMTIIGPVAIDEVCEVLAQRLTALTDDPPAQRYGRVLVTTLDDARGRSFAVAFVPGLAERIFPQRPREDPLLLDALRKRVSSDLPRSQDRIDRERLLLRLAVGAATDRIYLSYPRVDVAQGRPRVTSFYGLDVARAIRGSIPDIEAFERDTGARVGARLAWPAPLEPADAIDAAEHDLATLAALIHAPAGARPAGGAQYLLELNPHLGRSLRTRFWRWERKSWTELDGITRVSNTTAPLLAAQRLTARPYSPSALEQFAVCPYRFFLAAIQRLEPRTEVAPLDQLDPLTRGKLVHRVQAETLRALATAGALPITAATLAAAERVLLETLDAVAARFHDDLAPPILRVWQDEIAGLRGDLVFWLRHLADDADTWHPAHFELGFGLPPDDGRDPASNRDEVVLFEGLRLRGSVDLVERRPDRSALRVTDHKTGADRTKPGLVVGQGEVLQPVLYGLAVESALATPVREARLFFCTARGGFAERVVALDERSRAAGRQVLELIDRAIAAGQLHPAPRERACERCDFRIVCGPHEQERVHRKESGALADLAALRQRP